MFDGRKLLKYSIYALTLGFAFMGGMVLAWVAFLAWLFGGMGSGVAD